jgi:hypothetical protein
VRAVEAHGINGLNLQDAIASSAAHAQYVSWDF